jgi:hypothetical protein
MVTPTLSRLALSGLALPALGVPSLPPTTPPPTSLTLSLTLRGPPARFGVFCQFMSFCRNLPDDSDHQPLDSGSLRRSRTIVTTVTLDSESLSPEQ